MAWTKEQQLAIDIRNCDLLLSAAAGSGKTAVLVERIIQIVTDKDNPVDLDQLLVLTFTNAAASEMRERVGIALEKKVVQEPENEHLQKQLVLLNKASITTIHSFCLDIVRSNYNLVGIDPGFKIADEQEITLLKTEVLEELFEENYGAADNQSFTDLVECYGGNKSDQPLRELILNIYSFIQSSPFPYKWLDTVTERYNVSDGTELTESFWGRELINITNEKLNGIRNILLQGEKKCLVPDGPEEYAQTLNTDIAMIDTLIGKLNSDVLGFYDVLNELKFVTSARKKKDTPQETADRIKLIREDAKSGIKFIKEKLFFCDPQQMITNIGLCYEGLKEIKRLVTEFGKGYSEIKIDKQLVDFNDLEHFALQILLEEGSDDENPLPSSVAKMYQDSFYEIMTDEYQDSNFVQEMLLSVVSKSTQGKNNRFMVGDIKQSIYKFRLAQPELFVNKYYAFSDDIENNQVRLDLFKNFRSRDNVLQGINFLFEQIMSDDLGDVVYDDKAALNTGAVFDEYTGDGVAGGPIEISVIDLEENVDITEDDTEETTSLQIEIRCIADKIKGLFEQNYHIKDKKTNEYRPLEYRDIVILFRSPNSWVRELVDEFTNLSIPVFAESTTGFYDSIEVMTALNFLKIVDNPRNDIPLLSVLRSFSYKFTSNEFMEIKLCSNQEYFMDKILEYSALNPNTQLTDKINRFLEHLELWRKTEPDVTIGQLIEKIMSDSKFYDYIGALAGGQIRQANIDLLKQLADKYEKGSFKGLFNFIKYIEKVKDNNIELGSAKLFGEDENIVRIMSIHKSKGLEFPVVFVAGLGKRFNKSDITGNVILHSTLGVGTQFFDSEKRVVSNTLPRAIISDKIVDETLSEELRILYVALTRAKEKLILIGSVKNLSKAVMKWSNYADQKEVAIPSYDMKNVSTYLDWIMTCVSRHKDGEVVSSKANSLHIDQNNGLYNHPSRWVVDIVNKSEFLKDYEEEEEKVNDLKLALKNFDIEKDYSGKKQEMFKSLEFKYKNQDMLELPSNISITEIKRLLIDKNEPEGLGQIFAPKNILELPQLCQENEQVTSAELGTGYHTIMQHLDFSKTYNMQSVESDINALFEKGILEKKLQSKIKTSKVLKFFETDLYQKILNASFVKKEQPFTMGIMPEKIYGDEAKGFEEKILVHGIMDCFFKYNEDVILIDYKTDYVENGNENQLIEKYFIQLELYAQALENLLGTKVSGKFIYSLWLDKFIEVK